MDRYLTYRISVTVLGVAFTAAFILYKEFDKATPFGIACLLLLYGLDPVVRKFCGLPLISS